MKSLICTECREQVGFPSYEGPCGSFCAECWEEHLRVCATCREECADGDLFREEAK